MVTHCINNTPHWSHLILLQIHAMRAFWFLTLLGLGMAQEGTPSVYFVYRGESYISGETWLLSLSIDFQPFNAQLDELHMELDMFANSVQSIVDSDVTESQDTHLMSLRQDVNMIIQEEVTHAKKELSQLDRTLSSLMATFGFKYEADDDLLGQNESSFSPRNKRAALPFLGNIISAITGVATQGDLKAIKRQIRVISDKHDILTQVLEKALTVINVTRQESKTNREAIEKLSTAVTEITHHLDSLYTYVTTQINDELLYNQLVNRVHSVFHLLTSTMRRTATALVVARSQLETALRGRLPFDLVNSRSLKGYLRKIKRNLPRRYLLPYDDTSLLSLYKYASTFLVTDTEAVHIVVAIPIAPISSRYEIYEPIYVPHPSLDPDTVLSYQLEGQALAISSDQKRFQILSAVEASMCIQEESSHCRLISATFATKTAPACINALFQKDQQSIDSYCRITSSPAPFLPVVRYLFDGKWLIYATEEETIALHCRDMLEPNQVSSTLTITKGVNLIDLPMTCAASSRSYDLPPYFQNTSDIRVRQAFDWELQRINSIAYFHNTSSFAKNIKPRRQWSAVPEFSEDTANLDLDLAVLRERLQDAKMPLDLNKPKSSSKWLIPGLVGAIIVLIVIILTIVSVLACLWYRFRLARAKQDSTLRVPTSGASPLAPRKALIPLMPIDPTGNGGNPKFLAADGKDAEDSDYDGDHYNMIYPPSTRRRVSYYPPLEPSAPEEPDHHHDVTPPRTERTDSAASRNHTVNAASDATHGKRKRGPDDDAGNPSLPKTPKISNGFGAPIKDAN